MPFSLHIFLYCYYSISTSSILFFTLIMVVHDTAGFMIVLHNQLFNLKYTPLSHGAPGFSSCKSVGLHHFFFFVRTVNTRIWYCKTSSTYWPSIHLRPLFLFFFTWFHYVLNAVYHENETAVTIWFFFFFFFFNLVV